MMGVAACLSLGSDRHSGSQEAYARAALDRECERVVSAGSGRNEQLNKAVFSLGQLVGGGILERDEVESRLFAAAQTSGYVQKDGPNAARATIKSGLDRGVSEPRTAPTNGSSQVVSLAADPKPTPRLSAVPIPEWTPPGADGRPKFLAIGKPEPTHFDDEVRRHRYVRDGETIRVKVKRSNGSFTDWYRVKRPSDGAIGWQAKKPEGFVPVPYLPEGAPNPFTADRSGETLVWSEGEKDADTLHRNGIHGFSFGGSTDVPNCDDLIRGHHIIIADDNDPAGVACTERKVAVAIRAAATSIKVVRFTELKVGGDVTDFFEAGGTAESFLQRAEPVDPEVACALAEPELASDLERLNAEFCVVLDCGRARVLHFQEERQKKHKRQFASYLSFDDFRNFHMNRFVEVGDKKVPLGHWWLRHPDRRQYRGLIFEPGSDREIDGRLNLWRGWGVEPKTGQWPRMKAHINEVLAGGDTSLATYITNWMAWAVQHPAERAQAAVVFKGKRGTGKGTLGNALCHIFGQHGSHISSAEHLAGRFNGHLRDACFLFADEAFWPGDRAAEGSLKRLLTEPDLFIESKGKDGIKVPNMLHVMMASNDDWVVPAGEDERRYAVFAVDAKYKQNERWFGPLNSEMENGGYEAMLFDLLRYDIGNWHPRRVPATAALLEQQSRGLNAEDAWWCELLETGVLWGSDPTRPGRAVSNSWEEKEESVNSSRMVKRKGLYDQARDMSPRLKGYTDHLFAAALSKQGCTNDQKVMRRRGWTFPDFVEARAAWEARFRGWQWRDPILSEWQKEP